MSDTQARHAEKGYSLKTLFLDPNNYRFIDKNDYAQCSDEEIADKKIQDRTFELLRGKNNSNISDLLASFKQNGYVPVDQIQVRKIGHQKYLVIEGNRRIAALKVLEQMHNESKDIGKLDPELFKKVPVIDYEGDDPALFKVLMGLKHISGNKKWPAINQAKLLESLYVEHNMSEDDIYRSLGISKIEMRTTRRTLALIDRYIECDFGDQFTSDKYSTFREIIKSPKIKEWLELSPTDFEISNINETNLYRLFSWISFTEEEIEDEDIDSDETQTIIQEPIIETALQVRELANIISDPSALNNLEATRSLIDATLSSETLGKNKLENALTLIKQQINTAFSFSYLIDDEQVEIISESMKKLNALLVTRNNSTVVNGMSSFHKKSIIESCQSHFSEIIISNYKRFNNLKIDSLSRVNIFAGINNSGKSTILEAIYMLSKLGDTQSILTMHKYRYKHKGDIKNTNLYDVLPENGAISASFNNSPIDLHIVKSSEADVKNKSNFIGRFSTESNFIENRYINYTDFFTKDIRHFSSSNMALCNSVISFSTSLDEEEVFKECYHKAVSNGAKTSVIEFIKNNIDSEIIDIELSDTDGIFTVTYDDSDKNMDLSQFGDGLQKIFYLGIKFAACSNGVLLLDEIENGIHKDLLSQFTRLIQTLAVKYNVQVFVTSHSKECIDAFIENKYKNDDICAYALKGSSDTLEKFTGEELEGLIDYINIDIRGEK